ncbi:MAG: hypothetical protein WEB33_12345 [Bacteroidota bacterium]
MTKTPFSDMQVNRIGLISGLVYYFPLTRQCRFFGESSFLKYTLPLLILLTLACQNPVVTPETYKIMPVGPILLSDTAWTYLGLGTETISALAIHPTNRNILYAGSLFDFSAGVSGKLFKTTNGGRTWDILAEGGGYSAIVFDVSHPETVYAVPGTIIRTTDGGMTWEETINGIQLNSARVQSLAVDPGNSNIIYAGTSGSEGGSLYKSLNGALSWQKILPDSLDDGIISLGIHRADNNYVYAGTSSRGLVLKSTNSGAQWTTTGLGATNSLIYGLAIDAFDPRMIFAGLTYSPSAPKHGIWKSSDGGDNWVEFNSGLPDSNHVLRISTRLNGAGLFAVVSKGDNGSIYSRKDSNEDWERIGIDELRLSYYYSDLKIALDDSSLYFAGKGVFGIKLK